MSMQYMIHACPQRLWYVENFLIPSMKTQGIPRADITVWCDRDGKGNLLSFVESCRVCSKLNTPGVWHLQDDVLIGRSFAERTQNRPTGGLICGFCFPVSDPCINFRGSNIPTKFMWYSFPCIYIPNVLAGEFADWYANDARHRARYQEKISDRRHDDWFFREFMLERHGGDRVCNLAPNLVDHVDYLIGGTTINKMRSRKVNRASYWDEPGLVEELEAALKEWKTTGDS